MPRAGLLERASQHLKLALPSDKSVGRGGYKSLRSAYPETSVAFLLRRRRDMPGDRDAVDMHRPGDVLDPLLACVFEGNLEPIANLVAHHPADTDFSWLGESFEAGGDVDAVAVDIALIEDHVAQIDADAELDPLLRRHMRVALGHPSPYLDGAAHRIDDAGEFDEQPVAGGLDDAASMVFDLGVPPLAPDRFQRGKRAFLVRTHQPRIPGDVGGQDRDEAARGGHCAGAPVFCEQVVSRIPRMMSR